MMTADPRILGGSIAGPGEPRDRHGVVVDADRAVLLDNVEVCMVEPRRGAVPQPVCLAMVLGGRINHAPDWADVLFLFDVDGAAAIVTELLALAARMDNAELQALVTDRLDRLAADDALGGGEIDG